ncbi:MAG TPA: hypothetical protein VI916_08580 [Acidimicrobiia bacterium]|nr:hypothetical protein [Acidimicrobiia bacterium]
MGTAHDPGQAAEDLKVRGRWFVVDTLAVLFSLALVTSFTLAPAFAAPVMMPVLLWRGRRRGGLAGILLMSLALAYMPFIWAAVNPSSTSGGVESVVR